MSDSTRLRLPYLAAAQSQKHVTHNDALQVLDALVHLAVIERDRAAPPASPAEGDRYLVGAAPTGAFAGQAGRLAAFEDGAWRFHQPRPGWLAYVVGEQTLRLFDGAAWIDAGLVVRSLAGLAGLGIDAAPDPQNAFAARLAAGYFTARGTSEGGTGDLRLTLNKEAPGRTATHLYQSAWSARAETGLAGDDRYRIKVSADGAAWRDCLVADPATGAASFPGGIADIGGGPTGGLRNHVINGEFAIAQRGSGPFALATGTVWTVDRWMAVGTGAVSGQVSRAASPPDGPPGWILTLSVTTAAAGALEFATRLEDVTRLAGKPLVLSFWYRTTSASFGVEARQLFGTGGSPAVVALPTMALAVSPAWQRIRFAFNPPAVTGKTIGAGSSLALRLLLAGAAPAALDIAGVQLEEGPVMTPFERRPPPLELLLARRYFRRSAVALQAADLALEMRAAPAASGTGPFDYLAEL
jgi:hypothetical protein